MASRLLTLYCSNCDQFLLKYRKEGSGKLIRLFADKIELTNVLISLKMDSQKKFTTPLICSHCGVKVGIPINFKSRLAYRLVKGTFKKTLSSP